MLVPYILLNSSTRASLKSTLASALSGSFFCHPLRSHRRWNSLVEGFVSSKTSSGKRLKNSRTKSGSSTFLIFLLGFVLACCLPLIMSSQQMILRERYSGHSTVQRCDIPGNQLPCCSFASLPMAHGSSYNENQGHIYRLSQTESIVLP